MKTTLVGFVLNNQISYTFSEGLSVLLRSPFSMPGLQLTQQEERCFFGKGDFLISLEKSFGEAISWKECRLLAQVLTRRQPQTCTAKIKGITWNYFFISYVILDKICFKESALHPNNGGGFGQGFSVWFLNFFFRQHLEVAQSSWCCFSKITSRAGSFSLEVQQCLDSTGSSSTFARFLFWIKIFIIHCNNRAGIAALHGIPGFICLKISCSLSQVFLYFDPEIWYQLRCKCSYFKSFSLLSELLYK